MPNSSPQKQTQTNPNKANPTPIFRPLWHVKPKANPNKPNLLMPNKMNTTCFNEQGYKNEDAFRLRQNEPNQTQSPRPLIDALALKNLSIQSIKQDRISRLTTHAFKLHLNLLPLRRRVVTSEYLVVAAVVIEYLVVCAIELPGPEDAISKLLWRLRILAEVCNRFGAFLDQVRPWVPGNLIGT
jgi:hypothetical protein